MVQFQQIPGDVSITAVGGDELNIGLRFTVPGSGDPYDLTGYTLEAKVYTPLFDNPDNSLGTGGYIVGQTVATFSVLPVDLADGHVSIGLTEVQTDAMSTSKEYRWYFRWVDPDDVTLTPLSGSFQVLIP